MSKINQLRDDDAPEIPFWKDRRILSIGGIVLAGLLLVGIVVGLVVYPRVSKWRQGKLLSQAQTYIEQEDYRAAQLLLEQAAQADRYNYDARRSLADFYEKVGSGRAVEEWEALTKAEPENIGNFLGLAGAALRLGRMDKIAPALAVLEKAGYSSPEYSRVATAFSLVTRNQTALEKQLAELTQIEPNSQGARFGFACVRLFSQQAGEAEKAREELEGFARGGPLQIRAGLQLIEDAPRRWPLEKNRPQLYINLAKRILDPNSSTRGVMSRLGRGGEPDLRQLIEHMKAQPAPDPTDAALLAQWMLRIGLGREAQLWLESLDEARRHNPAVLVAMAECAAKLEDWGKLELAVLQGGWGRVPHDVARLAFSAWILRLRSNSAIAGDVWANAVTLSSSSLAGLRALHRLAQLWQWPEAQSQTLTALTRHFPTERSAWRILAAQAIEAGNGDQFWRIYSGWAQATPGDVQVQAEQLLVGLLMRPRDPAFAARAAELFRQNQDNLVCRVAHALGLWRTDRAADGLTLLEERQIDYATEPRFALVYGLLLSAVGRADESEKMFVIAMNARLFPGEQALISQARARNREINRVGR